MKKTLIALMALGCVAVATEETPITLGVTFGNCNQQTSTSVTLNLGEVASGSVVSLVKTADHTQDVNILTSGTAGGDAAIFTPNSNVGNNNPWTATFKFDNVNSVLASLDSIALDVVILQGSGEYHPTTTTWTGDIVFTSTITTGTASDAVTLGSYTYTLTPTSGKGNGVFEFTMVPPAGGSGIDLTDVSSFNMTLALTESLSGGAYVGLKGMELNGQLVPEPTTATLSLLALAGLAARRRRASR